ncbi:MAG: hypothetical protein F4Y03_14075 [Alphaproteobacteria bacterium]|nr:hypothetical protein [Alphaproteobacteria bacterium]
MSVNAFDEFVNRQVARSDESGEENLVDWDKIRQDWLGDLERLYNRLEKYLKKYVESNRIKLCREKIELTENNLGTYEAYKLIISIGDERISAKPVGRSVIGARGRVDLLGSRGVLRIVYLDKDGPVFKTRVVIDGETEEESVRPMVPGDVSEEGWYIATLPPNSRVTILNKTSFRDAIMAITDA